MVAGLQAGSLAGVTTMNKQTNNETNKQTNIPVQAWRAIVRICPGVYLALKGGRFKALANGYFWVFGPLIRWMYRKPV